MVVQTMSRVYSRQIKRCLVGNMSYLVVWLVALLLIGFVIDSYVLTRERILSIYAGRGDGLSQDDITSTSVITSSTSPATTTPVTTHSTTTERPLSLALNCSVRRMCREGRYTYLVRSGHGRYGQPHICFNGVFYVSPEKNNANRGLNFVVVNEKTLEVEDVRTFDVYEDDSILIRYLKLGVDDGSKILLIASQDEASTRLGAAARAMLHEYGATLIDRLHFRDNYVMVGQKGLTRGSAVETVVEREPNKEFAGVAESKGCLGVPMGRLNSVRPADNGVTQSVKGVKASHPAPTSLLGDERPNCGVTASCHGDEFSLHVYTGMGKVYFPKICVNGKYVLSTAQRNAGRGLNVVVINPQTKNVSHIGQFDTFASDSSNLELFLDLLADGDIVVAVAFDEASTKLSDDARGAFRKLGSSLIQNLRFRDVWYFVGQKGIDGFSDFEQIEYASNNWPTPIEVRTCIPVLLEGIQIKPDPIISKNVMRREFCSKFNGYGSFCDIERIDRLLTPAPLSDASLDKNPVFSLPILVVAGSSKNALRMQLETLQMNPGIQSHMVTVMHDETLTELTYLTQLFSFKSIGLPHCDKYTDLMHSALEMIWQMYPNSDYVILLEEEVIPSQDFLSLLAQLFPVVDVDDSLIGISAWNENGYVGVSQKADTAYRVKTFPGLGSLLKRDFYITHMKGKLKECCSKRSWEGWVLDEGLGGGGEMIVPEMSRVYRRPVDVTIETSPLALQLFNRERVTNTQSSVRISSPELLVKSSYEAELFIRLRRCKPLDSKALSVCSQNSIQNITLPDPNAKFYSVYYEQDLANDDTVLGRLCRCFGLFYVDGKPVRGKHQGIIIFSYRSSQIFLIGSSTPYYAHKRTYINPITRSDVGL